MLYNRFLIGVICVFCSTILSAQEQLGMRLERYSGQYSLALNPANAAFNPSSWDVSLGAVDFFTKQNYAYVESANTPLIARNPDRLFNAVSISLERPAPADAILINFFDENRGKAYGVVQGRVSGPGFTARIKGQHTIGLLTAGRFMASTYRVPSILRQQPFDAVQYNQPVQIAPFRASALAWGEVGLHYGYNNADGAVIWSVGITPKLLFSPGAAYAELESATEYNRLSKDTLQLRLGTAKYGFTNDLAYASDPASVRPQINGRGAGMDIGIAWAMPDEDSDRPSDYIWKAGVSLLDVGALRFQRNAVTHAFRLDTSVVFSTLPIQTAATIEDGVLALSDGILGAPSASLQGNTFNMGLPTALSAQFDYRLNTYFYVSGIVVQRIPVFKNSLKRPNSLAIVPRFEHKWGMLSIPVVVSDYKAVHIGIAARLGWLYVGTDNLGSWIGKRSWTGTDVYAGLKINGFKINSKKKQNSRRGGLRAKDRRWKTIGCYPM